MNTHTATFQDTYSGSTKMELVSFSTKRRGERVTFWRWQPIDATGCITTGLINAFSSIEAAVRAASRNHRWSEVA